MHHEGRRNRIVAGKTRFEEGFVRKVEIKFAPTLRKEASVKRKV